VDAYVHVHDAGFYGAPRGGGISQSTLFLLEAVAAGVAAVVLIVGWRVPLGRRPAAHRPRGPARRWPAGPGPSGLP